jgi:hypothetical protein
MKFFIPAKHRAEAVAMLTTVQGRLEICSDYLGSWIQERQHPWSYIIYAEQWNSETAIYSHIRSSLYRRVLAVIDFSSRAPEISFYFVTQTKGMELIEALRSEAQKPAIGD